MTNALGHVVDALPGLVWTALPDGQIDFLNRRWHEYTGISAEAGCGRGWHAAVHPDDLPRLLEQWRSILARNAPGEFEARLRRFDGAYRWFLFHTCPVGDASGQRVKWHAIGTDIDDRRQAEDSLRARADRFRLIVDGFPAIVSLRTPTGDLEHVNRRFIEYSGATLEELKARPWHDTWHPDDRPRARAAWAASLESGNPCDFEGRRRRADGVYRWFHMQGLPLRDADGHIVLWYLLQTDVDDRKRAEALLAGEKRLLEMVARGQSLPAILDALCQHVEAAASGCRCNVVLVDPGGTRLEYGVGPSLPAAFIDSINGRPLGLDAGPCAMAAYLNEPVIVTDAASETRWAADGWCAMALSHRIRSCWSMPITSTTGKVLGTFALYHDEPGAPGALHHGLIDQFTHLASIAIERSQADAALRRSEAFLAGAQQLSLTGSFSWRVAQDEITWSAELYRIFQIDPGVPITNALIAGRVHPDDLPSFHQIVDWARRDGGDFEYEHRIRMLDDSVRHVHVVAHGTRTDAGQLEYFGAVQDVTERRLAEEALADVRSELAHVTRVTTLGALTASIAHEVNQPLSGIVTNASTCLRMLAADPPNVDGARETARRTIRDGNRAAEVITRLRALFSKQDVATAAVDLNEAAREVIALSRSELQRRRVILQHELAENLPPVAGDRVQLQQVMLNLLLNASDAMDGVDDRPRQVVIRTECEAGDGVRLTVRDAGVGLGPQGADKLFQAFYTTKAGGMGIGLSVSRSIIESHQGRLWAAPNDGPGATFAFSIPRGPKGATSTHDGGARRTPAAEDAPQVRRSL